MKKWQLPIFFVIYFIAAIFSLTVNSYNQFASLMWIPTGLALASLVIYGRRLWPAVFLGAFVVNFAIGAPWYASLGIAVGNTLEALVGAWCCTYGGSFSPTLSRRRDVARLIFGAAIGSTLISATLGVGSLWLAGLVNSENLSFTWMQWWAGNVLSNLSIGSLLLVWSTRSPVRRFSWEASGWLEKTLFAVTLISLSFLILGDSESVAALVGLRGRYAVVPVLLWAALRFGQRGSTLATFTIALTAVCFTAADQGTFSGSTFQLNLLHLVMFVATMAITGLMVGAVATEREMEREALEKNEAELLLAKEAAEKANLAKSTFLADMSHEIRTPLGVVLGFSELISDGHADAPTQKTYLAAIRRNGELLMNIISDTLDLSQIEAGKMNIQMRDVAMSEILGDLATFVGPAKQRGIEFRVDTHESAPKVIHTDPLRLKQVLFNVVGNAIKFTSQGRVIVSVSLDGHHLSFAVQDTGVGLTPAEADSLFMPFTQATSETKAKFGGTGLGLVLSKRLAQLLGGDVTIAATAKDHGSTFKVTVNANPRALNASPTGDSPRPSDTKGRLLSGMTVLVAEDVEENQKIVQHFLNLEGAEVIVAGNGEEALARAKERHFDLLLMDLQMPVMDGFQAVKELRRTGFAGKIIALTARALSSDRARCMASGFDEHLSKPVDRKVLVRTIHSLVRGSASV